jgi:hypothetical protein
MDAETRVKLFAALYANGDVSAVDSVLTRIGGAELRETAMVAIKLLAEARNELADLKTNSVQA